MDKAKFAYKQIVTAIKDYEKQRENHIDMIQYYKDKGDSYGLNYSETQRDTCADTAGGLRYAARILEDTFGWKCSEA